MFRVLSALVIGAVIVVAFLFALSLIIGGDWVSEAPDHTTLPEKSAERPSEPISANLESIDSCDDKLDNFKRFIADSRACTADSDCILASFGCPFGCLVSVNAGSLERLTEKNQKIRHCQSCVYSCRPPVFEWSAVCVQNQCGFRDGSVLEFEERTREAIAQ